MDSQLIKMRAKLNDVLSKNASTFEKLNLVNLRIKNLVVDKKRPTVESYLKKSDEFLSLARDHISDSAISRFQNLIDESFNLVDKSTLDILEKQPLLFTLSQAQSFSHQIENTDELSNLISLKQQSLQNAYNLLLVQSLNDSFNKNGQLMNLFQLVILLFGIISLVLGNFYILRRSSLLYKAHSKSIIDNERIKKVYETIFTNDLVRLWIDQARALPTTIDADLFYRLLFSFLKMEFGLIKGLTILHMNYLVVNDELHLIVNTNLLPMKTDSLEFKLLNDFLQDTGISMGLSHSSFSKITFVIKT
jgi:hypothetical protein